MVKKSLLSSQPATCQGLRPQLNPVHASYNHSHPSNFANANPVDTEHPHLRASLGPPARVWWGWVGARQRACLVSRRTATQTRRAPRQRRSQSGGDGASCRALPTARPSACPGSQRPSRGRGTPGTCCASVCLCVVWVWGKRGSGQVGGRTKAGCEATALRASAREDTPSRHTD